MRATSAVREPVNGRVAVSAKTDTHFPVVASSRWFDAQLGAAVDTVVVGAMVVVVTLGAEVGVGGGVEGGVEGGVVGGVLGGPPPPPEPVKGPVEFDDRMTRPVKLSGPDPEYTDQAIEHEIQGTVVVKCVVTTEGIVKQCRVLHSLPFMDKVVVDALLRRRYSPAMVQGKPIEVDFTFTIRLKLPE